MCGFIAQLVEHRTGIAEVTGSNPVEALIFFRRRQSMREIFPTRCCITGTSKNTEMNDILALGLYCTVLFF